jgi:glycosyltransferase involved in cell wall biosynthesis
VKLSILIPTLPSRWQFFSRLMGILEPQLTPEVDLIWLGDARQRSLGEKRNNLLSLVKSDYLCFVDDDDRIHGQFVEKVLSAIEERSDVIVYDQTCSVDGGPERLCRYGIELEPSDKPHLWTGKPAHTSTWRSEIAKQGRFPEKNFGEDFDWVAQVWPLCKTQTRIEGEPLYFYEMNHATTETRKRRR